MGDLIDLFGGAGFDASTIHTGETPVDSPQEQLISAMREHGIACPSVTMDGTVHRFGKDRSSWYVAFGDGVPAGAFGDWKTGVSERWSAAIERPLTDAERDLIAAQIERAQELRREEEHERHEKAAGQALSTWDGAAVDVGPHEYLERKGIGAHGARIDSHGRLVLPIYSPDGELRSLQFIAPDGSKRFLTGGEVTGNFGFLGAVSGDTTALYLAEGFATAATIHEATGDPVFYSYSAHNLPAVARYVSGLGVPMTIVGDNDESGTGQRYALKASEETGAPCIIPPELGDANDYAARGGDLLGLLGVRKGREWLVPFDDLISQPAPVRWLVKRWLPRECLGMIHGPSGCGKTFFTLDLALSVASGRSWGGAVTRGGPVVYLAGEGHHGLRARCKAWIDSHGATLPGPPRLVMSEYGVKLDTANGYNFAKTAIDRLPEAPCLIIVDTLHRFLGGDENSSLDAGKMIEACDRLKQAYGAAVLLVHHTGNSGEAQHRARGSSAWKGALDVEIGITGGSGEPKEVRQHKLKDAPEKDGSTWGEIQEVQLDWLDEDGDPVRSGVFAFTEKPAGGLTPKGGINDMINTFQRGWFHTGAEMVSTLRDGLQVSVPYVSASGMQAFLESNDGLSPQLAKAEVDPRKSKKLIGALLAAEMIKSHLDGWLVINDSMASRLMVSRG